MGFSDVSRKQAFFTHLSFSACIFAVLAYLIIFAWYPSFYFYIDGGVRALVTIFFVDVVLGPGLTLLVFKPGKKSLKFDMAVILLLQFSALTWGVQNVYSERPATTVFYWGKFSCIAQGDAGEIDLGKIMSGPSGMQHLSLLQVPDSDDERSDFIREAFKQKSAEIYYYGKKIVPLDDKNVIRLDKYALDFEALRNASVADADMVEAYIKNKGVSMETLKLIPLTCRYGKVLAVYDTYQLKIIDTLYVNAMLHAKALDIYSDSKVTVEYIVEEKD